MFKSLRLGNFKGFANIEIPFKPVTLLSGLNSAGKSSVIQSLLLLKQIDWQRNPSTEHAELFPNGPNVSLGSGKELLHEFAENDQLSISYEMENGNRGAWTFNFDANSHRLITTAKASRAHIEDLEKITLAYLSAERWGPRVTYPYEDDEQVVGLGNLGQFAMRYLIDHGEEPVENISLRHPESKGVGLLHQVQAWLGEISPGVRLDVKPLREAGVSVAGFGFERRGDIASRYYRPTHVGFGLTYSLPLLVLLLSAAADSIVILENPEAHLHPKGQAQLARIIALASAKIQVIVETHSDHIMNGLRVAVKRKELNSSAIVFHYLRREGVVSEIDTPEINSDGRLSFWPNGFFDEQENLLAALVRNPQS